MNINTNEANKTWNKKDNQKYGFRETCFGLCVNGTKLLLIKENGNQYSLIGGGIEEGENHEQCLKREFLEEAGCYIKSFKELCTIDCFWVTDTKYNMESLAHIFIVEIEDKKTYPTESDSELCEMGIEEVEKLLTLPYHKRAVIELISYLNQKS